MKTEFLGQAYSARAPTLASQTAINIYPELTETTGSDIGGFYGTPGLTSVYTGAGEVRGLWVALDLLYAVIGATVYRIDTAFTATNLGTLPNNSGRVSMTDNGSQLAIAHQNGWHYVSLTGTAIAAVASAPSNSVVVSQDNYGIFTEGVDGQFGLTDLADLSSINPLDIATAEGAPDDLVSIISDHREVWLFGTETTEIWSNTGAAFFPFERAPGGFIEQGCAAKWSPAKIDNSVFWLGRDKNGRGVVYRANAYIPVRISTHAIETSIGMFDITDAIGYTYQDEGHSFYVLTFPTGDITWVYDVASKGWHQRGWQDGDGFIRRHRSNCYAFFNGQHIVGDWQNGKLYAMDLDVFTDDGTPIYRERAWEMPDDEHKKTRLDLVEVIATVGDGDGSGAPIVWLQVSKDAGQTWSFQRQQTLGAIGQRKARARWRRGGAGRDLVLRIGTTMTQRVCWVGANVQGETYAL